MLVEPSLSSRIDEFIAFSKKLKEENKILPSAFELRELFIESLGKTTVYRAGAFNDNQIDDIKQNGFISNFYRSKTKEEILNNKEGEESLEYAMSDLQSSVNVHAGAPNSTKNSLFISVSDYPEMAQYASFAQLEEKWPELKNNGYKLMMIPIEIDKFYCLRYNKYLKHDIKGEGDWKSDQINLDYNDPGIESLIQFSISPEKIDFDSIVEYDQEEIPKFKFEKK